MQTNGVILGCQGKLPLITFTLTKPYDGYKRFNVFHKTNDTYHYVPRCLAYKSHQIAVIFYTLFLTLCLPVMSELCKAQKPVEPVYTLLHDRNQTFNSLTSTQQKLSIFQREFIK